MSTHSQCGCGPSSTPCGCCVGTEALTPEMVANRPGLSALTYRVGTHATFLETMLARLSTIQVEHDGQTYRPLGDLATRDADDPSIALLDAWATVADVLTFYQERIANEGYLRTATERRSIIELARLVGYRLRPGVAASVYLALTLEKDAKVVIDPYGVRAQSVPGPGELPQSFENIEKIDARGRWNKLTPRLTQPLNPLTLKNKASGPAGANLYLKGITTGLNPNDPLLVVLGEQANLYRLLEVTPDPSADRTKVVITPWLTSETTATAVAAIPNLNAVVEAFAEPGVAASHLDALKAELSAGKTEANLADFIEGETLPSLERVMARRNISNAFRDRVRTLSEDLAGAATTLRESAATAQAASAGLSELKADISSEVSEADADNIVIKSVISGLTKKASVPPANALRLNRKAADPFAQHSDLGIQAIGVFQPSLLSSLPSVLVGTPLEPALLPKVYAFQVKSAPFGQSAQPRSRVTEGTSQPKTSTVDFIEWVAEDVQKAEEFSPPEGGAGQAKTQWTNVIYLDGSYEKILPNSWIVIDTSEIKPGRTVKLKAAQTAPPLLIGRAARSTANISRNAYGYNGKTTRIELAVSTGKKNDAAWMKFIGPPSTIGIVTLASPPEIEASAAAAPADEPPDDFLLIRRTVVYAQAEELQLTEEPIVSPICTNKDNKGWIVLDGVYSELKSGRWVLVEGERTNVISQEDAGKLPAGFVPQVVGVKGTEVAMLSQVLHDFSTIPGDTAHTRIKLATDLQYCYARDKVTIYANVVKATHGETRREMLGSGDGSKPLQPFALKQAPLTYTSAPTPSGVESTLKVYVNDVEWHETESLLGLRPSDRRFVTTRNDAEVTTAIFGNGKQGARLPTGHDNVRAQYRQGLGKAGNVGEGKITLLAERPLGVKEVVNPQRASGGADPESRDQARKNAPLAVLALDRLVSTSDYADFARTFGGVGKAFSTRLSDGTRDLVHVTIAGAGDAPIDEGSDLLRNLRSALRQYGDAALPVSVAMRELVLLVVSAGVRLLPDYVWEKVAPKIRAALLEAFSFEARELGQEVFLSEVISVMQSVQGVAYVDVDALGGVAEKNADGSVRTPNELNKAAKLIVGGPDEPTAAARLINRKVAQRVRVNLPELSATGGGQIRPAQLAYMVPEVPDTLILSLIE